MGGRFIFKVRRGMVKKLSKFVFISILLSFLAVAVGSAKEVVVIPLNSSAPAVVNYGGGYSLKYLTSQTQLVRSLTLDIPHDGLVIVNVSGIYSSFGATDRQADIHCSISQDAVSHSASHDIRIGDYTQNIPEFLPFAGTRTFESAKGSHSYNLVCYQTGGVDGELAVKNVQMNAVYYKTQ